MFAHSRVLQSEVQFKSLYFEANKFRAALQPQ
jgi:hypothetical protein